jgi:hypothetical protein
MMTATMKSRRASTVIPRLPTGLAPVISENLQEDSHIVFQPLAGNQ